MPQVTSHAPGTFCWVDLAARDAEAARQFYSDLFGWGARDMPGGEGSYTILTEDGKSVCGLLAMMPEMLQQGVPPHWQSYVSVENIVLSAARALELGGTLIAPPFDVPDAGRMAVVQDPTGAALALWQPGQHVGAEVLREPNALCWNELYTKDLDAAAKFYGELFGWSVQKMTGAAGQPYTEFKLGDHSVGGMLEIQEQWGPMPPHWGIYFAVENCDGSLEKAKSLGAKAEMPPVDIENVGRFAVLADPQGAHFAVIQMYMSMG